jgi:hypothetical protein
MVAALQPQRGMLEFVHKLRKPLKGGAMKSNFEGQVGGSDCEGNSGERRIYTDEERRMFEERLNAMSRAEFAAFVRDLTVDTVRNVFILPLVDALVAERRNMEVFLTSLKYSDFWEYRELMIEINNKNPGLVPEQVYRMAKEESLRRGN